MNTVADGVSVFTFAEEMRVCILEEIEVGKTPRFGDTIGEANPVWVPQTILGLGPGIPVAKEGNIEAV